MAYNKLPYIAEVMVNKEPDIPDKPYGPETGKPHQELTYTTSTIDNEGDLVYYQWCWGDGHYSEWEGPFSSSETVTASHTYSEDSTFFIKVKAKDEYELETDWSEKLTIRIEKSKSLNNRLSSRFIDQIIDLFPNLLPILKLLIQLS
jgi:hypothetical protein